MTAEQPTPLPAPLLHGWIRASGRAPTGSQAAGLIAFGQSLGQGIVVEAMAECRRESISDPAAILLTIGRRVAFRQEVPSGP